MTLREARAILKQINWKITKHDDGKSGAGLAWTEYRVIERGGTEATAYYSDDIEDAVATAKLSATAAEAIKNPAGVTYRIE